MSFFPQDQTTQSVYPDVHLQCPRNRHLVAFSSLSVNSHIRPHSPFPKRQILDSFKLKEFADDNLKFDEYGRKFSESVENTVEKGEIARYEQFHLFPQYFQKTNIHSRN